MGQYFRNLPDTWTNLQLYPPEAKTHGPLRNYIKLMRQYPRNLPDTWTNLQLYPPDSRPGPVDNYIPQFSLRKDAEE